MKQNEYFFTHSFKILRHGGRRRLALRVRAGCLEVLSPPGVSDERLHEFVRRHETWWREALARSPRPHVWANEGGANEIWPYLGSDMVLTASSDLKGVGHFTPHFEAGRWHFPQGLAQEKVKSALYRWYRQQARDYLMTRTADRARELSLLPREVHIKNYKARWGSCDSLGRVQLNWRLIFLPEWVVDYVIVHELCHLVHLNHSKAFWQLCQQSYAQTPQAKNWLKQQGYIYIAL